MPSRSQAASALTQNSGPTRPSRPSAAEEQEMANLLASFDVRLEKLHAQADEVLRQLRARNAA